MSFSLIPFVLLVIPVMEITVFILIGGQIGVWWTLGLILLTAIIGSFLLRMQGFQILNQLRKEASGGKIPGRQLGHGAMILVAGVLLLTPGFVTDGLGFSLFIPFIRDFIWRFLSSRIKFVGPLGDVTGQSGSYENAPYNGRDDYVVDLDPEEFHFGTGSDEAGYDANKPRTETEKRSPSSRGRSSPWLKD